jgi:hypothetical protein
MHEAREAIREARAAQRRALKGAVDNTGHELLQATR